MHKKHTGPSPADRQLFKLWDTIEAERRGAMKRRQEAQLRRANQEATDE